MRYFSITVSQAIIFNMAARLKWLGFKAREGIMNLENKLSNTTLGNSKVFVNSLKSPTLLMQAEPRQVVTANKEACELLGKNLNQIEGYRGGEVFDCIHSFTEKGCGVDPNCKNCKIKSAVVETFSSGKSHVGVQTIIDIKNNDTISPYIVIVSTKKIGSFALITIDDMYMINT